MSFDSLTFETQPLEVPLTEDLWLPTNDIGDHRSRLEVVTH